MAEVYNSYDTWTYISELTEITDTHSITDTTDIIVDNKGNKRVLPVIEIEVDGTTTINSISNDEQVIQLNSFVLDGGDKLILNFRDQIYEHYDNSDDAVNNIISDIALSDLIAIKENEKNTFTFDVVGSCDISITYETYNNDEQLHYMEQFKINKDLNYKKIKPFNSNKITKQILDDIKYTFSITKLQVDWLDEEKEYRIKYRRYNSDTYKEDIHYLVGCRFDRLDNGYNSPDDIMQDNVSGTATNILKH